MSNWFSDEERLSHTFEHPMDYLDELDERLYEQAPGDDELDDEIDEGEDWIC